MLQGGPTIKFSKSIPAPDGPAVVVTRRYSHRVGPLATQKTNMNVFCCQKANENRYLGAVFCLKYFLAIPRRGRWMGICQQYQALSGSSRCGKGCVVLANDLESLRFSGFFVMSAYRDHIDARFIYARVERSRSYEMVCCVLQLSYELVCMCWIQLTYQ